MPTAALDAGTVFRLAGVALAAAGGGAMNSIAGGGTLLTFPALIALGIPPLVANATSTVALWPGAVASFWGYREALVGARRWVVGFAAPSLVGGLAGALLLLAAGGERFADAAPWLVLGATGLFALQGPVTRWIRSRSGGDVRGGAAHPPAAPPARYLAAQLLVGVYGGFFGAGVGILMLAILGLMGQTHIHRMNGLKNWGGLCMNAVATATFAASGIVDWPVALTMSVASVIGGYAGARMAQRVSQPAVRRAVAGIGVAAGVWMLAGGMG